jgi:hypothetical protein
VWERSPAGTAIALGDDGLVASFESALPGHAPDDVVGRRYYEPCPNKTEQAAAAYWETIKKKK